MSNAFRDLVQKLDEWTPDAPVPDVHTHRWLRANELPGTPFLYEGRVPYGIWTHWAAAGGYKSQVASQLEHSIAYGHPVPGLSWEPARTGNVLVVDPDGTSQESQERTFRIAAAGTLKGDGTDWRVKGGLNEIITIHEPKGVSVEERIAWLWQQLKRWEEAVGPIPWIRWDTLASLLGSSEKNAYDHAQQSLQRLNHRMAHEQRVLFLPHHADKKGGMIGSTAIYGSSNLVTKVVRTKGANTGTIEVDGKSRGTAPWSLSVAFESGLVRLVDYHPVQARHKPGSVARAVADRLVDGPATNAELYEATGAPPAQVRKATSRLSADGHAERDGDTWQVIPIPGQPEGWGKAWPTGTVGEDVAEPKRVPIPSPRTEPEPTPELIASNAAIEKMIELLPPGQGLYPVRKLTPEMKAQMPYQRVNVGGTPNRYQWFPTEPPEGKCLVMDRRAAYFQSAVKVWLVPNVLHRRGDLDYQTVTKNNLAGMFQLIAPHWTADDRPNPLGPLATPGSSMLVPRATLDRVMDCVKSGLFAEEPHILYGLVGKGTEALLGPWARWCMDARRELVGAELDQMKGWQSQAVSCLRKLDPDNPGPVDRPDWQYAIHGIHYATVNRHVFKAMDMGETVLGAGNTDEIVWLIPPKADPETWTPPSMADHIAKNRYAVKHDRTGARWRDAGTWFGNPRDMGDD